MENDKSEKIRIKNFEIFYNRRQFLDEIRIKISDSFDKYLLTFSTGSLYLSIIFTNSLGGELKEKAILAWGWIFLLVSIFSTLMSSILSEKAHNRAIEITDFQIEDLNERHSPRRMENIWITFIYVFKGIMIFSFMVGIIFLTFFYFLNLK